MHVRCPHCHNPIDVVDDDLLADLTCPSCGSHFNLISGGTTKHYQTGEIKSVGRFELVEQVGIGHFGSVWKARDTELDRTVAVKIPRNGHLEPAERELFFREARAAAQLRHPNIVSVHEVGRDEDNTLYIVSDYVDGANLKEWLTGQQLTSREATELIVQIADAVHHAHESGVIHRDLKPSNVMLDMDGRPHVTDFGLARREAGEITMTVDGRILGTPAYMPPEQARGEGHTADRRSDVYSLGVILFELLTGELPFRGEQRMLILQVVSEEPPSPRKLNSRISKDLETICLKCMQKVPDRRYPTCKELSDDLTRHLKGEPIAARPVGRTEWAWRWCKRNPRMASLSAIVMLLLLTVAIGSTVAALVFSEQRRQVQAEKDATQEALDQLAIEKARTDQQVYYQNIELADRAIKERKITKAKQLLLECPEQFRGWEWGRLQYLCNLDVATFAEHPGRIRSVAFSPDGTRVALGCMQNTTVICDIATETVIHTLEAGTDYVFDCITGLAFSQDGTTLTMRGTSRNQTGHDTITLWDVDTGQKLKTIKKNPDNVSGVAMSPDGNVVAISYLTDPATKTHRLTLWSVAGGEEMLELKGLTEDVFSSRSTRSNIRFAFTKSGKLVAAAGYGSVSMIWDVRDGSVLQKLAGHDGRIRSLCFSPNDQWLVSASEDNTVRVWEVATGREIHVMEQDYLSRAISFSPDGKYLLTGNYDGSFTLWETEGWSMLLRHQAHSERINAIAFSPDGDYFVTASEDDNAKVWSIAFQGDQRLYQGHTTGVTSVAFSPDGNELATAAGQPYVGDDVRARLWNVDTCETTRFLLGHARNVGSICYSPDGTLIATGGNDNSIRIWDRNTGRQLHALYGIGGGGPQFTPDGRKLVDSWVTAKVWDTRSWEVLSTFSVSAYNVDCISVSPSGRYLATGGYDHIANLWDLRSGERLFTYRGHHQPIVDVSFSPDERYVATGSWDKTVKLWNVATGQEARTFRGHDKPIDVVEFHPDGRRLATGAHDSHIRIWDVSKGRELLILQRTHPLESEGVIALDFSPDGYFLASGYYDRLVVVWPAFPWKKEVYPGDASVPFAERIRRYKHGFWERRLRAIKQAVASGRRSDRTQEEMSMEDESSSQDDDAVVEIHDERLRRELRNAIGTAEEVIRLRDLKELTHLRLRDDRISELTGLEHCENLLKLDLRQNQVADLTPLASLKRLVYLNVSGNGLRDIGPLAELTALQWLNLSDNRIVDFTPLQRLEKLIFLNLSHNQTSDLRPLSALSELRFLHLGGLQLTDRDISSLRDLINLVELDLKENRITDVDALSAMRHLMSLSLEENRVLDISPLSNCVELEQLTLTKNKVTQIAPLIHLPNLFRLALSENPVGDIQSLSGLTRAVEIDLSKTGIKSLVPLSNLAHLKVINVDANQIIDLSPLVANPSLDRDAKVYLGANPLSQRAVQEQIPALQARGVDVQFEAESEGNE